MIDSRGNVHLFSPKVMHFKRMFLWTILRTDFSPAHFPMQAMLLEDAPLFLRQIEFFTLLMVVLVRMALL